MIVLLAGADALAWGPGTHVRLANDLMTHLWLLPASLGAMLARHTRLFLYGNVAADIVFAKKFSRIKQICHHWATGFSILHAARDDQERAFAYGYLSHLAADTVAHNKFLPRQMALSRSTIRFGHLYWEVRADGQIEPRYWAQLRGLLAHDYAGAESLLQNHLRETLLSFGTNQVVFQRINLLVSMRSWRRSVSLWGRVSRWPLPGHVLADYRSESLERMMDVLTRGADSVVLHEDPNGNSALGYARAQRRQLRQMKRGRMNLRHVIGEAAALHAPNPDAHALLRHTAGWHPGVRATAIQGTVKSAATP